MAVKTQPKKESNMASVSPKSETAKYRPTYAIVAEQMAEAITSFHLSPGERLPSEHEWSQRLGVSRTVIREAIKVLITKGQVQVRKGSGLYVAQPPAVFTTAVIDLSMPIDPEHVLSLFEFRRGLELQTVQLAAERITVRQLQALQKACELHLKGAKSGNIDLFGQGDTAFHLGIAEAANNPFLLSAVKTVLHLQDWAMEIATKGPPGSLLIAVEQHEEILVALQDGQGDAAASAMSRHIEQVVSCYQQEVRRKLLTKDALEEQLTSYEQ